MEDYNPFYDNQIHNNQPNNPYPYRQNNSELDKRNPKNNSFQIGAQNILKDQKPANEILQQIQEKEKLKKQKLLEQWEYERKIAEQPVAYLQQNQSNQYQNKYRAPKQVQNDQSNYQYQNPPQEQTLKQERYLLNKKKNNNSNLDDNQYQNAQGGVFASVFDIREAKQNEKQRQQQAYANEIQRQIEEKKFKKQEEDRKKFEEDILYEEKVKRELEEINRRNQLELEKKQNDMKSLPRFQDQKKTEQSKVELETFRKKKDNKNNKTEQYSRFLNDIQNETNHEAILELKDDVQQQQEGNQSYNNISMTIPINNISQNNIVPQYIQDADERFELQQRETSNFPMDQEIPQQYSQSRKSSYRNQQVYNPIPQNRQIYSMENYMKQYQELQAENRQKNMIQEEDLKNIKFQLEQQVSVLNNELVKLRAEEQMSIENKRNAYMDLENLKDQLRRQEYEEKVRLDNIKKNYGYQPSINTYNQPNANISNIQEAQKQKLTFDKQQDLNIDLDQEGNQTFVPLHSEAKYMGIPTMTENLIDSRFTQFQQNQANNIVFSELK